MMSKIDETGPEVITLPDGTKIPAQDCAKAYRIVLPVLLLAFGKKDLRVKLIIAQYVWLWKRSAPMTKDTMWAHDIRKRSMHHIVVGW